MKKAVFLDRDGVLNVAPVRDGKPYAPMTPEEVQLIPSAKESLDRLRGAGYELVVVTNQPDVARGTQTMEMVNRIDGTVGKALGLSCFYVCPHDDKDNCDCRKPKPGLILRAASELDIDLSRSFLIGDRWRDIGAGQSAGVRSFFIQYHYGEKQPSPPFTEVADIAEAVDQILQER